MRSRCFGSMAYSWILSRLLILGAFPSGAFAQTTFDAALYQPIVGSRAGARALVTPLGGSMEFGLGAFVEVELPVDELGRRVAVNHLVVVISGFASIEFEVLGRAVPGGTLTSFGLAEASSAASSIPLPVPTRLAALRLEFRRNLGTFAPALGALRVHALTSTRQINITGHGWFVAAPRPGSWTSFAVAIQNGAQDDFGLLFATVGAPLLGSPTLLMPTAQGGLLLDPQSVSLIEARPLLGAASWPFVISFPYDPAIVSAPIHLQALLGDALPSSQPPLLFWTRPLTIHP